MRKNFLWIMATAIIFSSCAKAPEEVKKENDILNNTEKQSPQSLNIRLWTKYEKQAQTHLQQILLMLL